MWLNKEQISDAAIRAYRGSLMRSCPNHIVIDDLFDLAKLNGVMSILQQPHFWKTQKHTYSALHVDSAQWQKASKDERFVQRDVWQREARNSKPASAKMAHDFLCFLREDEFMSLLSRIFNVPLTDLNVADAEINTNYFRLSAIDFVEQHADDSPGREVCMLLYLNREWSNNEGGELVFRGKDDQPIHIAPLYNRCVLFDPSSEGSEHWVKALTTPISGKYRYNLTSWYWSE